MPWIVSYILGLFAIFAYETYQAIQLENELIYLVSFIVGKKGNLNAFSIVIL